jgi:hypothetical protein
MKIVGTYNFTVFGNGIDDEYSFSLKGLQTPNPIAPGLLPTGISDARVGNSPGGCTATLDADIVTIKFDIPPSSSVVRIDALFDYHQ